MHDLQLVGFTTDHRGLIFRTRAGARPEASFVVPITDELVALVTQLADGEAPLVDEPHRPDRSVGAAEPPAEPDPRPRSQMSVRDIQARLRAGEPTARIATEAGVDEDWIERFAPPVRAEQQRIVARALDCHLRRARSAPSAAPLRRAVGMALADKGIAYTVAAYEAAWSARLLGHDRWAVSFTYHHRGRDRVATWAYDAGDDALTTVDRTAAQLGYVAPGQAGVDDGAAVDGIVGDPAAITTRAATPETQTPAFGPSPSTGSVTRRSTGRTSKPATPTKRAAGKKAAAKKASARKAATRKASATRRASATKAATEKAAPTADARKSAAATAPATKAPAKAEVVEQVATPEETPLVGPTPPPVADPAPAPGANGHHRADPAPPSVDLSSEPGADEVDATSARRARAAARNASTVHLRSGSAAPVRVGPEPRPSRPVGDPPAAPDDRPRSDRGETNGAARPATRRRRQLRAR